MEHTFSSIDYAQMRRIAAIMDESQRIFLLEWGIPAWPHRIFSFGSCAWDFGFRQFTDSQLIQITSALVGPGDLVLAFTMSGRTAEIMGGLQMAKARGARTVLFTGGQRPEKGTNAPDEVVHLLSLREIGGGLRISPQVPMLMLIDTLYVKHAI